MILKHINDIATICSGHGVETAIISPGSRSAPLSLAFNQHPDIDVKIIPDERSAAFIGVGIAQQQKKPVVLICTSGSAVYNYAPAVAEAYYQEIPLIIISADRPPEWTNQYDGQTIQQSGIFGKHVKASYDTPVDTAHPDAFWHSNRLVNEAILSAQSSPKGPVHINVPLREPFYPESGEQISFPPTRIIEQATVSKTFPETEWEMLTKEWELASKRLIVIGQSEPNHELTQSIQQFSEKTHTPVVNDIIGNQHAAENIIQHQDVFLKPEQEDRYSELFPDLLITVGKSLISKQLKLFIRKNPPQFHWHIHDSERVNDTLQHLTRWLSINPENFFSNFIDKVSDSHSENFISHWSEVEKQATLKTNHFLENCAFGEFQVVYKCLKALPEESQLHLANSMSVRYANLIGLPPQKSIEVFANRGTSGIDGSNGTAVGAALSQKKPVTLLTGDMAFLYDRNAFWHSHSLSNLRIIVLNNFGGGIFRMIKGPQDQPDYEKLFETEQGLTAELTAKDYGFDYQACKNLKDLNQALESFYHKSEHARVIEVFSDSKSNTDIFNHFKRQFEV